MFSSVRSYEPEADGTARACLFPPMFAENRFTCGPASALMALAHARSAVPALRSATASSKMDLWREATYSLGSGTHYRLASSLARAQSGSHEFS